jgi:hypothetical protein
MSGEGADDTCRYEKSSKPRVPPMNQVSLVRKGLANGFAKFYGGGAPKLQWILVMGVNEAG